jgi:hypothetical protein
MRISDPRDPRLQAIRLEGLELLDEHRGFQAHTLDLTEASLKS